MNGAWTYKQIVTEKKTYIIAFSMAVLLFVAMGGAHKGYEEKLDSIHQHQMEEDSIRQEKISEEKRHISSKVPYQDLFMEFAPEIGWEWEMLAALAWNESHFNPQAKSPGGACGVMQLMPKTAAKYGVNDSTIFLPRPNIQASVKLIAKLQKIFSDVPDSIEQTKFVMASYNAGSAHIRDARSLARKYGANYNNWNEVQVYLAHLAEEEYYTDSVVKYGKFKSRETLRYVGAIFGTYNKIKRGELKVYNNQVIIPQDKPTAETAATKSTDSVGTLPEAEVPVPTGSSEEPEEHPSSPKEDTGIKPEKQIGL